MSLKVNKKAMLLFLFAITLLLSFGTYGLNAYASESVYSNALRVNTNAKNNSVALSSKNDLTGAYTFEMDILNKPTSSALSSNTFMRLRLGNENLSYLSFTLNGGNFTANTVVGGVSTSVPIYSADGTTLVSGNFLAENAGWCVGNNYLFKFSISSDGSKINIYYDRANAVNPCTILRNVINLPDNTDFSLTNGKVMITAYTSMPSFYDLIINEIKFNGVAVDLTLSLDNPDLSFSNISFFCYAKKSYYKVATTTAQTRHEKWVSDFSFTDQELNDGDIMLDVKFNIRRTAANGAVNGAFGIILGLTTGEETMNTNEITGFLFASSNSLSGIYRGNGLNMNDNSLSWANQQFLGQTPAGTPGKVKLADNLAGMRTTGGYFNNNAISNGLLTVHLIGKKGGDLYVDLSYRTGSGTFSETRTVAGCNLNGKIAFFYDKNEASTIDETIEFDNIIVNQDYDYPVTNLTINNTEMSLDVGEEFTFIADYEPFYATNPNLVWSSSNQAVATVDQNGKVTAHLGGIAIITVSTADGELSQGSLLTVIQPVTGISINKETATLGINKTLTLTATVQPINATNKNCIWSSSDETIATVNNGIVTAHSLGEVIISVITEEGMYEAECIITVVKSVESISLNHNEATLWINGGSDKISHIDLIADFIPADATIKTIMWLSDDEEVATVDANGKVTAVGGGTAIITAISLDGGKQAFCNVTVLGGVSGIVLNKKSITLEKGKSEILAAVISPETATNKNMSWTSSDQSVATVDANGKVTAVSQGVAIITVTTQEGNKKDTCVITVINPIVDPDPPVNKGCGYINIRDNGFKPGNMILLPFILTGLLLINFTNKAKKIKFKIGD